MAHGETQLRLNTRRRIAVQLSALATIVLLAAQPLLALGEKKCREPEKVLKEFATQQNERTKQGRKLLTLIDLIDMHCDDHKRETISRLAAGGGPFYRIRGRWDLIDDPSVALPWAYHEEEPLKEKVLEVLQRTFPLSKGRNERIRIAALLYRYHNDTGRNYLLNELLKRHDAEAGLILALNREAKALAGIGKVLETHTPSSELIYALGRWGSVASPLLSEGLLSSRGSRGDYVRALTMAEHSVDSAVIDRIRWMYEAGKGGGKADAAAALVLLQPGTKEPLDYLLDRLEQLPVLPESEKLSVLRAVSRVDPSKARGTLVRIVGSYVSNKETIPVASVDVEAAILLLRMENEEGKLLVVKMLRKMLKEDVSSECYIRAIARAIADSGLPNSDEILNELMGVEFVVKVHRLRALRTLPRRLLPVSSRPLVGTAYSVGRSGERHRRIRRGRGSGLAMTQVWHKMETG